MKRDEVMAGADNLPFVNDISGDGGICLRIGRGQQGPVDIRLRTSYVRHIVSMMPALSSKAQRLRPAPAEGQPPGAIPLALSAINIGQDDAQQTFMMLEVGMTALTFGLRSAVREELGQTLLALSAQTSGKPS